VPIGRRYATCTRYQDEIRLITPLLFVLEEALRPSSQL